VCNSVAYAHACEEALGVRPSEALARVRTILLELERTWSHLNDISAVCSGVGLAAGASAFAALTDQTRNLNATITGHRFAFGSIQVGSSAIAAEGSRVAAAREELSSIAADARRSWRELLFNASFQDRLPDIGVVSLADARSLGAVGPAARASGLSEDARTTSDRLLYDGFTAAALTRAAGDVRARLEQRALELDQCFGLLDELLIGAIAPANAERADEPRAIGTGRVESARGATLCIVEQTAGRVDRLRLRTGSYANWPVVAHAAAGDLLPDFPLINKSFELCYACADR
jgi:Ni,Fe-hydrogenase III large subunit